MQQPDPKEKRLRYRRWIVRRHQEGWSIRRIAYEIQLPGSTVHRWTRWHLEGRDLEERVRGVSGRQGRSVPLIIEHYTSLSKQPQED